MLARIKRLLSPEPSPPSPEKRYRSFLEALGSELDRSHPGVFQWRFGKPSANVVDGLIITRPGVRGYVFVVGACQWPGGTQGGTQGGVWRAGARHSYSASVAEQREWEHADVSHWQVRRLESRCFDEAADVVNWLIQDWAFERPWVPPQATDPKAEIRRLQRLLEGLGSHSEVAVVTGVDLDVEYSQTPEAQRALVHDLAGLLPDRIRDTFPPDKRGAMALSTTVVLAWYETMSPPGVGRKLGLVASSPQRRSDRQEISIRLEALIPENQDHRWEGERWRWHVDTVEVDRGTRWGAAVPVESLAAGSLAASVLADGVAEGTADAGDKAALAILLQDQGRLIEALELYGIEIDGDVKRLCGGQKIYPPACCAYPDEQWTLRLQDWMRSCAPWLLPRATRRDAERLARIMHEVGRAVG